MCKLVDEFYAERDDISSDVLVEDEDYYVNSHRQEYDMSFNHRNFIKVSAILSKKRTPYIVLFGEDCTQKGNEIIISFHTALQLRDWFNKLEGDDGFIMQGIMNNTLNRQQLQALFPLVSDAEKVRTPQPLNLNEHLDEPKWDTSLKSDKNGE